MSGSKQKIAILGGGLAGLSTAYWLSQSPDAQKKFEITIYQQGWRLGGKGASGRNLAPGQGDRIEEHGLHIWFGFYENAFRTYRQVLESLRDVPEPKPATFTDWRQAFAQHSLVVLGDNGRDGLEQWPILFSRNDREPGLGQHPSDWGMFVEALQLGMNFFEGRFGDDNEIEEFLERFALPSWATQMIWRGEKFLRRNVLRGIHKMASLLPQDARTRNPSQELALAAALEGFRGTARGVLRHRVDKSVRARRIYRMTDLLATVGIGILRDGLLYRGFESVDHIEFRQWLRRHGADAEQTLDCNFTRVLNDLMFGYVGGNETQPNIAAGTAARIMLLAVSGYDGSFMYKMKSGMGDTIFVPLYALLKARGVRFEFFQRVDKLHANDDGQIETIDLTRQVKLKAATKAHGGYQPLHRVGNYDTWPATPDFDQIVNGSKLAKDPHNPGQPYNLESSWTAWPNAGCYSLQRGKDFDLVVNTIPVAALEKIGADLIPRSRTFQRMFEGDARIATTRTQAMQLWLNHSAADMGWRVPERMRQAEAEGLAAPLLGGYFQPFNTWCDMTQVLGEEHWGGVAEPASISYFCGQLPDDPDEAPTTDHGYPARQLQVVRHTGRNWLSNVGPVLWPKVGDPLSEYGIRPDALFAPDGAEAFSAQYFRANIDPSERYTLSLAGTTASRPPPHCPEFQNLFFAGDWTYNPVLNAGCVESTVASAMAASRAICGFPQHIEGEQKKTA